MNFPPTDRAEVLTKADVVADDAKTTTMARNVHGNTITERDVQAAYDRARQEYIEVHDKFSFYTETVQCESKVVGKPAVLKFARYLPICSCHVRTEDVTLSTRLDAKGKEETRYSLKDDALIYTPKQIWTDYITTVVPISKLESPRDRGSGFTQTAAYYKEEYVTETMLREQTLVAMNDLYSENFILKAQLDLLTDNLCARDTALAIEQALTAEVKQQCALELEALQQSMNEGSLTPIQSNTFILFNS